MQEKKFWIISTVMCKSNELRYMNKRSPFKFNENLVNEIANDEKI